MLLSLYKKPEEIYKKNNELNILVLDKFSYLPYVWYEIENIFYNNTPENIKENTVGIHWFNGGDLSKDYQNLFETEKNGNISLINKGSIFPYIQEYIK